MYESMERERIFFTSYRGPPSKPMPFINLSDTFRYVFPILFVFINMINPSRDLMKLGPYITALLHLSLGLLLFPFPSMRPS